MNEQNVVIIPEAIFSLCAGFSSSAINSSDVLQLFGDCKIYSKVYCFRCHKILQITESISELMYLFT